MVEYDYCLFCGAQFEGTYEYKCSKCGSEDVSRKLRFSEKAKTLASNLIEPLAEKNDTDEKHDEVPIIQTFTPSYTRNSYLRRKKDNHIKMLYVAVVTFALCIGPILIFVMGGFGPTEPPVDNTFRIKVYDGETGIQLQNGDFSYKLYSCDFSDWDDLHLSIIDSGWLSSLHETDFDGMDDFVALVEGWVEFDEDYYTIESGVYDRYYYPRWIPLLPVGLNNIYMYQQPMSLNITIFDSLWNMITFNNDTIITDNITLILNVKNGAFTHTINPHGFYDTYDFPAFRVEFENQTYTGDFLIEDTTSRRIDSNIMLYSMYSIYSGITTFQGKFTKTNVGIKSITFIYGNLTV